jgi:hypothetical protein
MDTFTIYFPKNQLNTVFPFMLQSLKWPLFLQPEFCMQFSSVPCVNSTAAVCAK